MKTYEELENFLKEQNIDLDSLIQIGDLDEAELSKYSKEFLKTLAEFLGFKFDDLFIDS